MASPPPKNETPQKTPRRRRWLLRLATATVVPAAFLLALEIGLRVAGYGLPTSFWVPSPGRSTVSTNPAFGRRFFPPGIERAPLDAEIERRKPTGKRRVFVLGGSAAMGYPEPAYGLARMLSFFFEASSPGANVEVLNTAMTAINSHVVREIARDCARYEPDLFVVYMGNNEVVGPFGPGTAFSAFSAHLRLIRSGLWLRSTRVGELTADLIGAVGRRPAGSRVWRGMEMFLEKTVAVDDPRLDATYAHFRANLTDICRAGQRAGAPVILCTVATDLADTAPFASARARTLDAVALAAWTRHRDAGIAHAEQGRWREAGARFAAAAAIDDSSANLAFRRARCETALGNHDAAEDHYARARDLDRLRFRADSAMGRIIRDVAKAEASRGVHLVDAEAVLAASPRATNGVPGRGLFLEHVHLNFSGNHTLARAVHARARSLLSLEDGREPPSEERCARALAWTGRDRHAVAATIESMGRRPPFTNQFDHAEQARQRAARVAELARHVTRAGRERAVREYEEATAARPHDHWLWFRFAEVQAELGDHAGAAQSLEHVLDRIPSHRKALNRLGLALASRGRFAAAEARYRAALARDPTYADVHNNLGLIHTAQRDPKAAIACFRRAIELKPNLADAHYNLGFALRKSGRTEEAVAAYRRAIEIDPDLFRAHNNLANALQSRGELAEAIAHYREALRIEPDHSPAHHNLGCALQASGQFEEAVRHFEAALARSPSNVATRRALDEARRAAAEGAKR